MSRLDDPRDDLMSVREASGCGALAPALRKGLPHFWLAGPIPAPGGGVGHQAGTWLPALETEVGLFGAGAGIHRRCFNSWHSGPLPPDSHRSVVAALTVFSSTASFIKLRISVIPISRTVANPATRKALSDSAFSVTLAGENKEARPALQ
jgi:hypothetical protein